MTKQNTGRAEESSGTWNNLMVRERAQVFNAYLARHADELCHAKHHVEKRGLACKPESKFCADAL